MDVFDSTLHLAVNSRLTQFLKSAFIREHAQQAQASASLVLKTPQVMTWMQWWQTWQQALMLRGELPLAQLPDKVISDFEAQGLWQALLDEACEQDGLLLLNVAQTAKQLHQAWLYDHEYFSGDWQSTHVASNELADGSGSLFENLYLTEETQLYLRLKSKYLQVLAQKNLWDAALLMQHRLAWFAQQDAESLVIQLHGFDVNSLEELSPYMKRWMTLVQAQGGQVSLAQSDDACRSTQRLCRVPDDLAEAQQAAFWAVRQLKQLSATQPANTNSNANLSLSPRIAIVAPELSAVAQPLVWALDELLLQQEGEPLKLFQNQAKPSTYYNVSLGHALRDLPLVKNALQLLEFSIAPGQLDYNQISEWLVSPYTPGDFIQRQTLDFRLRSRQWAQISMGKLLSALTNPQDEGLYRKAPKALLTSMTAMTQPGRFSVDIADGDKPSRYLNAANFYQACVSLLDDAGWAESSVDGALNSVEFQQKQALLKALHQFSDQLVLSQALKPGQDKLTAQQWFGRLRQYLSEQLHQPESVSDAPIQVMGMLEAGGQRFDALWVMGMTAAAWPRGAKPNPFLPMGLQQTYQLPRADVARELRYAQGLTARLAGSAPEVVWSYAQQTNGQLNLISPLIERHLQNHLQNQGGIVAYPLQAYRTLAQTLFEQRLPLDWVEDAKAPEAPIGEKVPGGSSILTAQRKCPLMAFFDYRLGAKHQLETVEQGLQSNHLGTLVHQVLEWFWQDVKTQAVLLQLSDQQLQQKIDQWLQPAIETLGQHFNAHYLALEKRRIGHLLFEWLQLEKQRPAFEVVGFEQGVELDLAGIKLSVKIDRIDLLQEPSAEAPLLILDYKTGKASINDLLKTPLDAPQLAVYLHAFEGDNALMSAQSTAIKAIGYGMIHSDDGVKFSVVAENEAYLPNKKATNFEKLADKAGGDFEGMPWEAFVAHLKQAVWQLAESVQQGHAEMLFDKPADIQYAASLLALRLPEAKRFLAADMDDSEAVGF